MKSYGTIFERAAGGGWHVQIGSVTGCRAWGRTLDAARRAIRERLVGCGQVDPDAALLEDVRLPAPARRALADLARLRAAREALERELAEARLRAAEALAPVGLSVRDAGELLGLSHESARQLALITRTPAARSAGPARRRSARRTAA